jgi:pyruvate ferredoxin oxidoreductase alpha subunit
MERGMVTGNYAAAHGVKYARAEVIPVYPITPQTSLMEKIIEFINNGELDAEFVPVESEHTAMAVAIAAEAMGARSFTASSSQGLVYMHEMLFVASGMRLPIVMCIVNRSIGAPNSLLGDLQDSLDTRDASWIQLYAENAQEIMDMVIQAYKIAEDKRVLLPVAICYEGIIISHCMEPVTFLDQQKVDQFLSDYYPDHVLLDPERPTHVQAILTDDAYYMEYKYQQQVAMENAKLVIQEVDQNFENIFGRRYGGLLEAFGTEDAEVVLLTLGSISSTARRVVRDLREKGILIGFVKLRFFRPFPREVLQSLLARLKGVAVIERDASIGSGGVIYTELSSALYMNEPKPKIINYIVGLGGREVTYEALKVLAEKTLWMVKTETTVQPIQWIGVRGLS